MIVAFMGSSLLWIFQDWSVWPWDQAWYGQVSLSLHHAWRSGLHGWWDGLLSAFGSKPPLLAWIGEFLVPLARVTGRAEPALLLVNIAAGTISLAVLYHLGRRLGGGQLGALSGALFFGSASLTVGLNHQFFVEPLQCTFVAWGLYVTLGVERRSTIANLSFLIGIGALSLLVKTTSLAILMSALFYGLLAYAFTRGDSRPGASRLDWFGLLASLGFLALCFAWYHRNWEPMALHVSDATNSDTALLYGRAMPILAKLVFWIETLKLQVGPSPTLLLGFTVLCTVALLLCAVGFLRVPLRQWGRRALSSHFLFALMLTGTVCALLVGYASQINEEPRFLAPLLPLMAALLAWSLGRLRSRALAGGVVLLLALNGVLAHAYAWGANPLNLSFSSWLHPVHRDATERDRLMRAVALTCTEEKGRYNVIGVEYPAFNANSAAFYSEMSPRFPGYPCYYTSLGHAESDPARALARLYDLNALNVVFLAPHLRAADADAFNRVNAAVAAAVAISPDFSPVADPAGELLIYRRRSGDPSSGR